MGVNPSEAVGDTGRSYSRHSNTNIGGDIGNFIYKIEAGGASGGMHSGCGVNIPQDTVEHLRISLLTMRNGYDSPSPVQVPVEKLNSDTGYRFDKPRNFLDREYNRKSNEELYWRRYHARLNRSSMFASFIIYFILLGFAGGNFSYFDVDKFVLWTVISLVTSVAAVFAAFLLDVLKSSTHRFIKWITASDI